jgi:hypothetical protein
MNDLDRFANDLKRIKPARLPPDFSARLKNQLGEAARASAEKQTPVSLEQACAEPLPGRFTQLIKRCISALALRDGLRNRTPQVWRQSTAAWFLFRNNPLLPRILAGTVCLTLAAVAVWKGYDSSVQKASNFSGAADTIKADDVEINQELVSSFDTVARLPGGEPVRFRCQKWMDQTVINDKARGLTIEQRTPRLEIVPVRFETY